MNTTAVEAETVVDPADPEREHAKRVFKWLKSGQLQARELTIYDLGLLLAYYPWAARELIPDE